MSGFAPQQQALVDVIKTEVQIAVADKYQAEMDNLRNALVVAQRDLDHTRAILDELCAAFTAAESTVTTIRTDLDTARAEVDKLRYHSDIADNATTTPRPDVSSYGGDDLRTFQIDAASVEDNLNELALNEANQNLLRAHTETGATPLPIPINTRVAEDASPKPSEAALKLYAAGLGLRFPVLGAATKLCGTSDPWIIQELLNESSICRETPIFDSFERFVLNSHRGHPVYKVKHKVWGVRRLQSAIREYAPRAVLGFGVPSHSETGWDTLPADFRIFEAPGQTPEFDWDKGCSLAQKCHCILKQCAGIEITCLVLEEDCDGRRSYTIHFLIWS